LDKIRDVEAERDAAVNIAGFNLYRVCYLCQGLDNPFVKLVVAKDVGEARFLVPGQFLVELIESDISMVISDNACPLEPLADKAAADAEIARLRAENARVDRDFRRAWELYQEKLGMLGTAQDVIRKALANWCSTTSNWKLEAESFLGQR
jgi:hypothetical protein